MADSDVIERMECPACLSKDFTSIYALPKESDIIGNYLNDFYKEQGGVDVNLLVGWLYELCQCNSCKLVFQRYILGNQLMHVLYEKWINPSVTFEMSKKHPLTYFLNLVEEISQMINYFGKRPHELNFLDFGMGWAEWCKVASALGCNTFGAELSASRIVNAKKNNIEVIDVERAKDNMFDWINTEQVFEHIPEPLLTLKKLFALIKPGGIIKISVPDGYHLSELLEINDWSAPKGTSHSLNMVAPLEHINCFNSPSLKKMAQLVGLTFVPELAYRKYPTSIFDVLKNKYRGLYIDKIRANKGTYLFFQKPQDF